MLAALVARGEANAISLDYGGLLTGVMPKNPDSCWIILETLRNQHQRGLIEETFVICGGEFSRIAVAELVNGESSIDLQMPLPSSTMRGTVRTRNAYFRRSQMRSRNLRCAQALNAIADAVKGLSS